MTGILSPLGCVMLGLALAVVGTGCGSGVSADQQPPLERGRYLVEQVSMCMDCHTPMGPDGPVMDRHLMGAALSFAPTAPMPDWIPVAPPIAGGYPGWTKEQLASFMVTGINPQGRHPRPPMPHYRFSPQDAQAVAEYLASLAPTQ